MNPNLNKIQLAGGSKTDRGHIEWCRYYSIGNQEK